MTSKHRGDTDAVLPKLALLRSDILLIDIRATKITSSDINAFLFCEYLVADDSVMRGGHGKRLAYTELDSLVHGWPDMGLNEQIDSAKPERYHQYGIHCVVQSLKWKRADQRSRRTPQIR